jgi:hypothetical protein
MPSARLAEPESGGGPGRGGDSAKSTGVGADCARLTMTRRSYTVASELQE